MRWPSPARGIAGRGLWARRLWQGAGGAVSDKSFLFLLETTCFLIDSETSAYPPLYFQGKERGFRYSLPHTRETSLTLNQEHIVDL